jgi:hypothetical protein
MVHGLFSTPCFARNEFLPDSLSRQDDMSIIIPLHNPKKDSEKAGVHRADALCVSSPLAAAGGALLKRSLTDQE